jgi:hypothetical protein
MIQAHHGALSCDDSRSGDSTHARCRSDPARRPLTFDSVVAVRAGDNSTSQFKCTPRKDQHSAECGWHGYFC